MMKKLFISLLIATSFAPVLVYAQATPAPFCQNGTCTYTPLEPLPGQPATQGLTFAQYVGNLFTISIVIGAMIAVAVLIFSGITYMTSEAFPQKDWGKKKMRQALWALLLLLGSYLILNTINPNLVTFNAGQGVTNGVQTINPLQPCNYIVQSGGTAVQNCSTTAQYPSAASLNALPTCTAGQNKYPTQGGLAVCQ